MTEELEQNQPELTVEEIAAQGGEEIPDREAMSLVNANIAAPVNLAAALNVLSDNSTANATAVQYAPVDQTS
ncbi:MAG: hypothetical protein QOK05_2681 [Chloroflexota bacterium]|jgi:hypothetical protein|nr:hypothetical protein [Chloroflexota bacterium]